MVIKKDLSVKPRWPKGVLPLLTLLVFLAGEAVAFWPPSRDLPFLAQLYWLGTALFRNEMGVQVVMAAGALAHVVEAVIAARMCRERGLGTLHTCGWVGIVLLVGYFGIHSLKLESVRRRHSVQ